MILLPLYWRKKETFIKHFLFSLHFHSFFFLAGSVYLILSEIFDQLNLIWVNPILAGILGLIYCIYLFVALKKVYKQKVGKTLLKVMLLLLVYGTVLFASVLLTYLLLLKRA